MDMLLNVLFSRPAASVFRSCGDEGLEAGSQIRASGGLYIFTDPRDKGAAPPLHRIRPQNIVS